MNNKNLQTPDILTELSDPTNATLCRLLCDKRMSADLSGEYTLPDDLPEMRRLLRVNVIPTAPTRFISGNSVRVGGNLDYSVCYVGADGNIYGATFTGDYDFNAPFESDAEYDADLGVSANADVYAESVVGRVISARKLSLKARVGARIIAAGSTSGSMSPWLTDSAHAHTESLMKSAESCRYLTGGSDEIVIRDGIDGNRYVCADCSVFLEEVRSGEGYVDCAGSVRVAYLMRGEAGAPPVTVEKRYSLSETVELDGMKEGAPCTAFCVCTGIEVSHSDDGGESECVIRLRILTEGFVPVTVRYVSDAYSTLYGSKCERKRVTLPMMGCCGLKNMTFEASLPLERLSLTTLKGGFTPVSVSASASVDSIEFSEDGEKGPAVGSVTFNILYSSNSDEGGIELSSVETELPFKMSGYGAKGEGSLSFCSAIAIDPRVKMGSGELELGCELALSCSAVASVDIETVSGIDLAEEALDRSGGISICYPGRGESLWSVAKKYRVPVDLVRRENQISSEIADDDSEGLERVRYLIV